MHSIRYEPKYHQASVLRWLNKRGHPKTEPAQLPAIGVIVPGVAAAFLTITDDGIGVITGLVSNPLVSYQVRNEAIDICMSHLYRIAKTFHIHTLVAWTSNNHTLRRAVRHGFIPKADQVLIFKEL